MKSPAHMRSGCGAGFVIRQALVRITAFVIGPIQENKRMGHDNVTPHINTPQTCS